jgi:hypothetical protein
MRVESGDYLRVALRFVQNPQICLAGTAFGNCRFAFLSTQMVEKEELGEEDRPL